MFLNETNILETLEFTNKVKYKNNIKRIHSVQDLDLSARTIVKIVGVVKLLPTIFSYYTDGVFTDPQVKITMVKWYKDCVEIIKKSTGYSKDIDDYMMLKDISDLNYPETIEYICDKLDGIIIKMCSRYRDMVSLGIEESLNNAMCIRLTDYLQAHGYKNMESEIKSYIDIYLFSKKALVKHRLGQNMRSSMSLRLQYNSIADVIEKEEGIRLNNPSMFKLIMDFGAYNCSELSEDKLRVYIHELLNMKLKSKHYKVEPASVARIRERIKDFKNSLM